METPSGSRPQNVGLDSIAGVARSVGDVARGAGEHGDPERQKREFITWELGSRDTIDVKRAYIRIAGDCNAGILLSQIVYWFLPARDGKSKLRIERDGKWWLAKRREEWWDECCLSPRQFDWSVGKLEGSGLISAAVYRFNGALAKHVSLNWAELIRQLAADNERQTQRRNATQPNSQICNLQKRKLQNCELQLTENVNSSLDREYETRLQGSATLPISPVATKYDFSADSCGTIPEGLPIPMYARGFLEACSIPSSTRLLDQVGQAIGFLARADKLQPHEATQTMIKRALGAQGRGETVNGFWFTDGKWKQNSSSVKGGRFDATSRANQRDSATIEAATRAALNCG
jgi:hypothetical protein